MDNEHLFKKGRQKTGGRVKGTPNRATTETRELITKALDGRLDDFLCHLDKLDGIAYCKIYLELLKFSLPALQRVELEGQNITVTTMTEKLKGLVK